MCYIIVLHKYFKIWDFFFFSENDGRLFLIAFDDGPSLLIPRISSVFWGLSVLPVEAAISLLLNASFSTLRAIAPGDFASFVFLLWREDILTLIPKGNPEKKNSGNLSKFDFGRGHISFISRHILLCLFLYLFSPVILLFFLFRY